MQNTLPLSALDGRLRVIKRTDRLPGLHPKRTD